MIDLLVNRALASRVLIYGRNKFTLLAVISVSLIVLAHFTLLLFGVAAATGSLIGSDALVVPALVAHHMGRQGVVRTPRTVLPAASSVVGIVLVAGLVVRAAVSASGSVPAGMTGELAFDHRLVPFAVLLSALTAWGLQVAFGLRSGCGRAGSRAVPTWRCRPRTDARCVPCCWLRRSPTWSSYT